MTDFSKTLIPCVKIGSLIGNSEAEKKVAYEKKCNELAVEEAKFESMADHIKVAKSGVKKQEKIERLKVEKDELEATKDEFVLSAGFKSFLKVLYAYAKYGKRSVSEDNTNVYTAKGQLVEQLSIELINRLDGKKLVKNEVKLQNNFIIGIPDTFDGESITEATKIIDVKSSWDMEKFLYNLGRQLNPDYWWQMQGYLALTGAS